MEFKWTVVLSDGSEQSGVVASFEEAIRALRDWYGKGDGDRLLDLHYRIDPVWM